MPEAANVLRQIRRASLNGELAATLNARPIAQSQPANELTSSSGAAWPGPPH
jgi:hypothetical protein